MKKFIFLVIVVGLATGGYFYWKRAQISDSTDTDNETRTAKIEKTTIDLKVATTGKVVTNLDVDIKSKASGQITRLPYDISEKVSSGSLLAELDPIDEQRNVAQRQAALVSADARLSQARENLEMAKSEMDTGTSAALATLNEAQVRNRDAQARLRRQEQLFQQKLVSREDLDTVRSDAATAERSLRSAEIALTETRNLPRTVELRRQDVRLNESSVEQAKVDLDNARQRLNETKIYAPMDGVITSRPVQTGQIIASGISNVGGGTTLMTLSDLSHIFVTASVDEADIGKVRVGQNATITTDAYPNKRFLGRVQRIATKGTNTQNVVTFEVKIEVLGEGSSDSGGGGGRGGWRGAGGGRDGATSGGGERRFARGGGGAGAAGGGGDFATGGEGGGMRGRGGDDATSAGIRRGRFNGADMADAGGAASAGTPSGAAPGGNWRSRGGDGSGSQGGGSYGGRGGEFTSGTERRGRFGGAGGFGSSDSAMTSGALAGKELLKPEMTANIEIQAERHEDVLAAPNEAVQSRGRSFFVETKGTTESTIQVPIQIGITDGLKTEITSGVVENQEVVIPATAQSRWAQRPGGAGGNDASRGMRMATRSLGGGRGR